MLKAIKLTNLLSFGAETEITFNKGLNVLIGANGSGKSNLIEVISLLQALPKDLTKVIRDGGGIEEWLWKGTEYPVAEIEVIFNNTKSEKNSQIAHCLVFCATNAYKIKILSEIIYKVISGYKSEHDFFYKKHLIKQATIKKKINKVKTENVSITVEEDNSILMQRQDPDAHPEMSCLGSNYQKIRLYREWQFGRHTLPRIPQRADLPNDFLEEDASNLGLILNSFRRNPEVKKKLLESLKLFYENVEDFDVIVQGGYVQVFFEENGFTIPATRLSDGTLRYLSLLAILLHPNPPPLICIEEPELGLHPDILPTLIDLLKEAAQKTQIIITTHSADLIDDLSDMPEAILVFNKYQGSTTVNRLDKEALSEWLMEYKLGQLWRSGELGGNRW